MYFEYQVLEYLESTLHMLPTNYCDWQVNVVKGLKMFEDIFTDSELSKLNDFVNELRAAGQNGELLGLSIFPLYQFFFTVAYLRRIFMFKCSARFWFKMKF